jgi:hypothetical protein
MRSLGFCSELVPASFLEGCPLRVASVQSRRTGRRAAGALSPARAQACRPKPGSRFSLGPRPGCEISALPDPVDPRSRL